MFESRQLIGFEDIVGIQYECLRCHAKFILPASGMVRYPNGCQNCNEDWFKGQMTGGGKKLVELLATLRDLRQMTAILGESSNLRVTMEVVSQESEKDSTDEKD